MSASSAAPLPSGMRAVLASVISLLLLGLSAASAVAQVPVVGYLGLTSPEQEPSWSAFKQGLRDVGYDEGRTIVIESRWARGDNARFPPLVRDLLDRRPAVIFSPCGIALRAIRELSRSVPVVAICADVKNFLGEVTALSRPGGHTTGITFLAPESTGKRLQLLKELLPNLSRVAILHDRGENWDHYWQEIERVGPQLGLTFFRIPVDRAEDIDGAVATAVSQQAGALLVIPGVPILGARERLAASALKQRLPTAFDIRAFVVDGGLLSYGPDFRALYRRAAADYVAKILRGASAGDLPIRQPTRFELIVNLRTARTIGLIVPKSLLVQADEILE